MLIAAAMTRGAEAFFYTATQQLESWEAHTDAHGGDGIGWIGSCHSDGDRPATGEGGMGEREDAGGKLEARDEERGTEQLREGPPLAKLTQAASVHDEAAQGPENKREEDEQRIWPFIVNEQRRGNVQDATIATQHQIAQLRLLAHLAAHETLQRCFIFSLVQTMPFFGANKRACTGSHTHTHTHTHTRAHTHAHNILSPPLSLSLARSHERTHARTYRTRENRGRQNRGAMKTQAKSKSTAGREEAVAGACTASEAAAAAVTAPLTASLPSDSIKRKEKENEVKAAAAREAAGKEEAEAVRRKASSSFSTILNSTFSPNQRSRDSPTAPRSSPSPSPPPAAGGVGIRLSQRAPFRYDTFVWMLGFVCVCMSMAGNSNVSLVSWSSVHIKLDICVDT